MVEGQPLRADARRNRARVLEVAARVFATEGLSVPVHEIARRAEVGVGTVSRHFPTKEDLFEAVARRHVEGLISRADDLAEQQEPGAAFFSFFAAVVREGAADRGLAEQLLTATGDRAGLVARVGVEALCDRLGELLDRAQRVGAVRGDITLADVEALMSGCITREGAVLDTVIAVVKDGSRTDPRAHRLGPSDTAVPR